MKYLKIKMLLSTVLCVAVSLSFTSVCIGVEYTYTVLQPPGWRLSQAGDVNDNGVVAGYGMKVVVVALRCLFTAMISIPSCCPQDG